MIGSPFSTPASISRIMSPAESSQPKPGFVAVFVGATRGIGLATLQALTRTLKKPRFYVIGRSQAKFEPELAALRECNPDAEIRFLEGKISLLKEVDDVCDSILQIESHLDLLYMSPGSLAFGGPHCKPES
jgi:NAD(P)-dependent dehydrogenase (short-subunit alcohol dehydrogenase family)